MNNVKSPKPLLGKLKYPKKTPNLTVRSGWR